MRRGTIKESAEGDSELPPFQSARCVQWKKIPMSQTEVVVEGTLKPDGTLDLDQKPGLSPGRVQVRVKPLPSAVLPRAGLAEIILQIQQEQRARGFVGLSGQDLAAEQQAQQDAQDEYDQRCQPLWSQTQSGPPK
jgi:hypothetical protein